MSTSFSILGAVVVFAAAQLLLRKDAPAYAFLLSVGAALFVLLQLGVAVQELLRMYWLSAAGWTGLHLPACCAVPEFCC